jgi:hypothetical protein
MDPLFRAACVALIALLLAPTAQGCTNVPEKDALLEAKKQWDPYGKTLAGWAEGGCPCNPANSEEFNNAWKGVVCEEGRVVELNLANLPPGSLAGGLARALGARAAAGALPA